MSLTIDNLTRVTVTALANNASHQLQTASNLTYTLDTGVSVQTANGTSGVLSMGRGADGGLFLRLAGATHGQVIELSYFLDSQSVHSVLESAGRLPGAASTVLLNQAAGWGTTTLFPLNNLNNYSFLEFVFTSSVNALRKAYFTLPSPARIPELQAVNSLVGVTAGATDSSQVARIGFVFATRSYDADTHSGMFMIPQVRERTDGGSFATGYAFKVYGFN